MDICLWQDLSLHDVKQLWNCTTRDDIKRTLCDKLQYNFSNLQPKEKILLDLYFHTLLFAQDHKFNEEQTSVVYSITKRTHEKAVETPYGNLDETFAFFKDLLAHHSVKRPPFCVHIFPVQDVVSITDYFVTTYFRHYKLYKYSFTPKIVINVAIKYEDVQDDDDKQSATDNNSGGARDETDASKKEGGGATTVGDGEAADFVCPVSGETPAMLEMRHLIESALDEQISKLKADVDSKLKINEEHIMQKVMSGGKEGRKSENNDSKKGKKGK